uniref:Uncharacterized protein n=1 Tax=Anguilla anguilla TaxID=7936 RepID=A0A0E9RVF1_ANGAN
MKGYTVIALMCFSIGCVNPGVAAEQIKAQTDQRDIST